MSPDEFWQRVDVREADECWEWQAGRSDGRGRLNYDGRTQYAYRVAWELANGRPIPAGLLARHRCDNPACVNPAHIEPGTQAQNMNDAAVRGRARNKPRYGSDHHMVTVPAERVAEAVAAYVDGDELQVDIARRFGITQGTLSNWVLGKVRQDGGQPERERGRPFKPCGTRAAYERHRRNGERPCEECRVAELADQRRRRLAKSPT